MDDNKAKVPTNEELELLEFDKYKILFGETYDNLIEVYTKYMDIEPKYINILALWTLGASMHKNFNSYPILYINAMRGSGKTRLLNLMTILLNGLLTNSITESVLFRTKDMIALDEFESINNKDKNNLRELLNSGYKRGVKVVRMKEKKDITGKTYEPEYFEIYRPIVMANISGLDEVLEDRCISIILEKSNNPQKSRLIEDFFNDNLVLKTRENLEKCRLCMYGWSRNYIGGWNSYISEKYCKVMYNNIHTYHTYYTYHTSLQPLKSVENDVLNVWLEPSMSKYLKFYNKVDAHNIHGRNLEIFFPILIIANMLNEEIFDFSLKTSNELIYEKRKEETNESLDITLIKFISTNYIPSFEYHSIKDLLKLFREFADIDISSKSINPEWMGLALKRLSLITDKKRMAGGIYVNLNVIKAIEKYKMFDTQSKDTQ